MASSGARLVREPELAVRAYGLKVSPKARISDDMMSPSSVENTFETPSSLDPEERETALPEMKHVLVADLGGGTFDVCIVRNITEWDEIHMLFTAGDERLGGDDFDDAISKWLAQGFMPHLKSDEVRAWPLTKENRRRLRYVARKAKERLSSAESTEVEFAGSSIPLSRGDFNVIVAPTLQRMLDPIREASYGAQVRLPFETLAIETYDQALKKKKTAKTKTPDGRELTLEKMRKKLGLPTSDAQPEEPLIDEVLCIGAASWTPAVRELLELITGCKPSTSLVDPETAVAVGGAILASVMDAKADDLQVFSSWRAAWTTYVLKRPDLLDRVRKETGDGAATAPPLSLGAEEREVEEEPPDGRRLAASKEVGQKT